jgi:hypothetical protein
MATPTDRLSAVSPMAATTRATGFVMSEHRRRNLGHRDQPDPYPPERTETRPAPGCGARYAGIIEQ